jgi:hypothetical protein
MSNTNNTFTNILTDSVRHHGEFAPRTRIVQTMVDDDGAMTVIIDLIDATDGWDVLRNGLSYGDQLSAKDALFAVQMVGSFDRAAVLKTARKVLGLKARAA